MTRALLSAPPGTSLDDAAGSAEAILPPGKEREGGGERKKGRTGEGGECFFSFLTVAVVDVFAGSLVVAECLQSSPRLLYLRPR